MLKKSIISLIYHRHKLLDLIKVILGRISLCEAGLSMFFPCSTFILNIYRRLIRQHLSTPKDTNLLLYVTTFDNVDFGLHQQQIEHHRQRSTESRKDKTF
jgi:hypothetical protein